MQPHPKISVVIPFYNAEKFIEQTLSSLQKQTFKEFEVLCVDDGSSDSSVEILNKFSKTDPRIRVFQKPNGGTAVRCVVFALPHCRGDWFFFSSHDDFFSEDLLEKMYTRATETGAECILPDVVMYEEGNPNPKIFKPPLDNYDLILSGEEAFKLSVDSWKIHGNALRELKSFQKSGIDGELFNSDEFAGWRHFLHSKKIAFSHGTFFYRQNPNAITKQTKPLNFEALITDIRVLNLIESMKVRAPSSWNLFLKKRIKACISELRTAKKKIRNATQNPPPPPLSEEWERVKFTVKTQVRSPLLCMILRNRYWSMLFRFIWKLYLT